MIPRPWNCSSHNGCTIILGLVVAPQPLCLDNALTKSNSTPMIACVAIVFLHVGRRLGATAGVEV